MNSFQAEKGNVKIIGRTYASDGTLWMALSGTGIEFETRASACSLVIAGDSASLEDGDEGKSRIAIYVNGCLAVDDLVRSPEQTYEVWKSESAEKISVRLIKLSEAAMSAVGVKWILTDAAEIRPAPEKPLKLEFIGDSITCGYGTDDPDGSHHFRTSTENIMKTYSFLTAQELGADYSMVCYSGFGIISGYTEGERNVSDVMPPYYEKVAFTRGRIKGGISLTDIAWNFGSYVPGLIVIGLGSNDDSFSRDCANRQEEYREKYAEFLKMVRRNNPGAYLLCIQGLMGRRLCPFMEKAVADYRAAANDERASALELEEQKAENGYSADGHPSVKTHELAARHLVAEVRRLQGLGAVPVG